MNKYFKVLSKHVGNIWGWRTDRKILTIEIDDYGTSSVLSEGQLDAFRQSGAKLDFFTIHDRIADPEELTRLFDVLLSVKDRHGRPAVITPLTVVANPDYRKIEATDFQEYHYENFTVTFERAHGSKLWKVWQAGMAQRVWEPEFHGREHFNVRTWMEALRRKNSSARKAFEFGVCGVFDRADMRGMERFGAAFDYRSSDELTDQAAILDDGIQLFKTLIGYSPLLVTPPNGICSEELEITMVKNGIRFLTMPKMRFVPKGDGRKERRFHYYGQKSASGLEYTPRNCQFEPHNFRETDWVDACMRDIEIAFKWKKPAIISSHRVNFVRQSDPKNGNGILQLDRLLKQVTKTWPEVEFMSTRELATLR